MRRKGTVGHIVIGFIEVEEANTIFAAADELAMAISGHPAEVKPHGVVVNVEAHQVVAEVTLYQPLAAFLQLIEAECPTVAQKGSASAAEFVRRF